MLPYLLATVLLLKLAWAFSPLDDPEPTFESWSSKYGPQTDMPFSGPLSFAHLPYRKCLQVPTYYDIAILGMPYDSSVSFRPGARFGPYGIRSGSRRMREKHRWTIPWGVDPYELGMRIVDCGDVPITPFDPTMALDQMETAYRSLLPGTIITLGGDHTIVLPILRALSRHYDQPVSILHFDAHLDTWAQPSETLADSGIPNHGTFFAHAYAEGLLKPNSSVHAGVRCKMEGPEDLEHDKEVGFDLISTYDLDDIGVEGIIRRIRERVGDDLLYLSLDIDVIDPGMAPATGTPEPGGWTSRELKRILRGLVGLNFVGFDIVEVAPAYDTNAEITSLLAADLVHDFLNLAVLSRRAREDAQGKRVVAGDRYTKDEL